VIAISLDCDCNYLEVSIPQSFIAAVEDRQTVVSDKDGPINQVGISLNIAKTKGKGMNSRATWFLLVVVGSGAKKRHLGLTTSWKEEKK